MFIAGSGFAQLGVGTLSSLHTIGLGFQNAFRSLSLPTLRAGRIHATHVREVSASAWTPAS
jgi:hypothetical protein